MGLFSVVGVVFTCVCCAVKVLQQSVGSIYQFEIVKFFFSLSFDKGLFISPIFGFINQLVIFPSERKHGSAAMADSSWPFICVSIMFTKEAIQVGAVCLLGLF